LNWKQLAGMLQNFGLGKQKIISQIFFRKFFVYLLFFSDPRLNMLRRDVEELKEKTWELDSTTRNNLGTNFNYTP
jgi:hypothetical protein